MLIFKTSCFQKYVLKARIEIRIGTSGLIPFSIGWLFTSKTIKTILVSLTLHAYQWGIWNLANSWVNCSEVKYKLPDSTDLLNVFYLYANRPRTKQSKLPRSNLAFSFALEDAELLSGPECSNGAHDKLYLYGMQLSNFLMLFYTCYILYVLLKSMKTIKV